MDFFETLNAIAVPNSDDGKFFVVDQRLECIDNLLFYSKYRKINPDGLFVLYAAKPLHEINHPIIISTHVDCVPENMHCFVKDVDDQTILGTFDNLITNAAALTLMHNNQLPDNVLIAFTGDEEIRSTGASQLCRFLDKRNIHAPVIVLDVTDMGWQQGAHLSVENNFWKTRFGKTVIDTVQSHSCQWTFVPSDPDNIPPYVPSAQVIPEKAWADESWDYAEEHVECFSLCLPVFGNMHGREGVLARKQDCLIYTEALRRIVCAL